MTVKELIEALQECPETMDVYCENGPIEGISQEDDGVKIYWDEDWRDGE